MNAAAQSFLSNDYVEGYIPVVDSKAFFVCLVRVSTGEFMRWWHEAGLTSDVVSAHLLGLSTALVEAESKLDQIDGENSGVAESDYVIMVD